MAIRNKAADQHSVACVRRVDLDDSDATAQVVALLDAYAADPMGAGAPLPPEVRQELLPALRQHAGGTRLYLAYVDDTAVGLATCFLGFSTFQARPLLNIHDLAVLPAFRQRGVARSLLQTIARDAQALGCCKLTLEVREDNLPARGLYRSCGFGPGGSGGKRVQYLFLERSLAPQR